MRECKQRSLGAGGRSGVAGDSGGEGPGGPRLVLATGRRGDRRGDRPGGRAAGRRAGRGARLDTIALSDILCEHGAGLLPIADLLAAGRADFDQLVQDAGACVIQATLKASVEQMIGPKRPGWMRDSGLVRFGSQPGVIHLADRSVRVMRPRLRRRLDDGSTVEAPIPAYEALRRECVQRRIGRIVISGVSTRSYRETIGNAADAVGVSRSAISRECMAEAEATLKELLERPLNELDILVVMIDGLIIAGHHVLIAIGVSSTGVKHVLGVRLGASENAAVATALLEDIVARGVDPAVPRLFVIDGSKALRKAVRCVFGEHTAVQRCRLHKIRNVCDQLPEDQASQTRSIMLAAFSMHPRGGIPKLKEHIAWLKREHPSAGCSLEEGLDEMFTVNKLELPPKLARALSSTNMIESPNSSLRRSLRRVTRWRDGAMVLRWVGRALADVEERWRPIRHAKHLWILQQNLNRLAQDHDNEQAA